VDKKSGGGGRRGVPKPGEVNRVFNKHPKTLGGEVTTGRKSEEKGGNVGVVCVKPRKYLREFKRKQRQREEATKHEKRG